MKKLVLLLTCMWAIGTFAQDSINVNTKVTHYASIGLSLSNGDDFNTGSYSSVEYGINYHNLSLGAVFGRGNLDGIFRKGDALRNYYFEVKSVGNFPVGILNGSVLFGWGGYFNTSHLFIEYGMGISYSHKKMTYGMTYSNWDGTDYMTPSITFNF